MSTVLLQKAYVGWLNGHLKRHGHASVSDLVMDSADGTALCVLVQALTKSKMRFKAQPTSAADKAANISLALDTADASGVPIGDVTVEDFANM